MPAKHPEILAPVGNWEMCLAAVHNGADAVYVGMPHFNARGRAKTFELDELQRIIQFCHLYGVKVFVAFNVLIFERELLELLPLLEAVLKLSPDAFIVQDIGLARLMRFFAATQVLHASTQMSITSFEAIEATADLGLSRYVLGREVSIPEMSRIRERTEKELEVFVHGALCVSYSGQCLTSESFGGRSANRGQCAQSCRLQYALVVDGEEREMGEKRYLVSPKDLCALDDVPRLQGIGIDSLKIEGRLKSPEYVASTVQSYRAQRDGAGVTAAARDDLQVSYSRDFFNGWMDGVNHQRLVDARYSGHHGLELGEVLRREAHSVVVRSTRKLQPGDGVVFSDFLRGVELGGSVYQVQPTGDAGALRLSFANDFELQKVTPGMRLFLNASPEVSAELRRTFADKAALRRIPVRARVFGRSGESLALELADADGNQVSVASHGVLQPAQNAPLSAESLRAELGALGGTPFSLVELQVELNEPVFLHQRELKELRRAATTELTLRRQSRSAPHTRPLGEAQAWLSRRPAKGQGVQKAAEPGTQLNVLVRERSQLDALEGLALDTVYLDYEFGKDYKPSIEVVRKLGFKAGIATTRILKPGETGHLQYIERLRPDVVLVRNLGAWQFLQRAGIPMVGDFSLNVSNSLTAEWLREKGLLRLCPSYDLNREQLFDLLAASDAGSFEVTVHQYMPSFHMEHCVFAAFLSNGTSYRDCGRPCERHAVELRDRMGESHPVTADAECRNTMFNGRAQSAARLIPQLLSQGVQTFRLEALLESPEELRRKLEAYLQLLSGNSAAHEVLKELGMVEKYGVTEGQLLNLRVYQDRKKDAQL